MTTAAQVALMEPNRKGPEEMKCFSFQLPHIELLAPVDQFSTHHGLKEWAWLHHKDTILEHMIVQYRKPTGSGKTEDEEIGEEKLDGKTLHRSLDNDNLSIIVEPKAPNKSLDLLATIAQMQRQFFQSESPKVVFGGLLEALLDLMESEYGFIGEIKYEDDGTMYLQTHAYTNIAWDEATRQFLDLNIEQGLRFYNLKSLLGTVMTSGEPVISNNPGNDKRACGIPKGHPPLDHFLGIPFFKPGGKMNGMVGISNKPGGYSMKDVEFLEPFTLTCGTLIQANVQIEQNRYLINTLEESVKKRTRELELANTDLEEANRRVCRNSEKQLEHFACMSHEIRTPLNCIIGMSSLLKDTKMTPMQEESMRMIITSGDLLLAIVNDVLDYAKLETENVDIDTKRSNLQETLSAIIYSIEMKAYSTQSIKPFFDVTLPEYVHIDSRRLQQILFNLLGNAVKFSPQDGVIEFSVQMVACPTAATEGLGGSSVLEGQVGSGSSSVANGCPAKPATATESTAHIAGCERDDGAVTVTQCPFHKDISEKKAKPDILTTAPTSVGSKQAIRFVVKDHGKGIEEKEFERIFQPFQQVSETENVIGGTGLGLAITQKLVTAMGGVISVDSKKGSWSKFTVDLPCCDAPIHVADLSSKMQHWAVYLVGVAEEENENVMRVFTAYKMDVTTFDSMGAMMTAITENGAFSQDRMHVCLVHEDAFEEEPCKALSAMVKSTILTFGPNYNVHDDEIAHHFRSLEQILPSVLMETTIEKVLAAEKPKLKAVDAADFAVPVAHLRVLVAEDNIVNQKVVFQMLHRLGVKHVDIVDNGLKACEQEETQDPPYDIILMDQQMPVMGGVTACQRIVNRPGKHQRPKVVFLTAHVSPKFEAECKEAGCSGFLAKPFKIEEIDKCLHMLYACTSYQ